MSNSKICKVCICLSTNYPAIPTEFLVSIFKLQQYFYEWVVRNKREDTLSILIQGGYNLDKMRNSAVENVLVSGQTHLLFLDTDHEFPLKMIPMMIKDLEDNPKAEAVTGIYTWKHEPYLPHIFPRFNTKTKKFTIAGAFPLNKLFYIAGAPAGCLMVKAEVFKRTKKPWFLFVDRGVDKKIPLGMGEDLYFFWKCQPKTICDPRIICQHFYQKSISLEDYIKVNNLKVVNGNIKGTRNQFEKIVKKHKDFLSDSGAKARKKVFGGKS